MAAFGYSVPVNSYGGAHMRLLLWLVSLAIATASALSTVARAQTCVADAQCQRGGAPSQAMCSGDTLVVRRSQCQGGQCRDVEERRETCAASSSQRCGAGTVERVTSRCDGSLGRCVIRVDLEPCARSCICRDHRLTVSTGQCLSAFGCQRSTLICTKGCTCQPTPRCLD